MYTWKVSIYLLLRDLDFGLTTSAPGGAGRSGCFPHDVQRRSSKSLKSDVLAGSPFSDPPLGDSEFGLAFINSDSDSNDVHENDNNRDADNCASPL